MKAVIIALSMSSAAAVEMTPEAMKKAQSSAAFQKILAHVESMKTPNPELEGLPRTTVGEQGIASSIYSIAKSAVGRIRSMYSLRTGDDMVYGYDPSTDSDSDVCKLIHNTGCFAQTDDDAYETVYGFTFGSCSECAYGKNPNTYNYSSSCYTCPSGHSLQTMSASSFGAYEAYYEQFLTCTGFCIPDAQVDDFQSFVSMIFGGNYTYTNIDDAECKPIGSKYPLDCFPSDNGDDSVCFSGVDTVQLESGETKMLSEVQVGDRVLSADAKGALSYSDVVFLPHAANNKVATFVNIATEGGKALKATKTHLVQTCGGDLAYAGALKAGDCLRTIDGDERVASTSSTKAEGIYSVVAQNEFVVVSGIVASPFAFAHGATNAVYNLHRALYKFAPALLKSSAVVSANAVLGAAAVLAANLFTQAK